MLQVAIISIALTLPHVVSAQVGYHVSAGVTKITPVTQEDSVLVDFYITVVDDKGNEVRGFETTPVRKSFAVEGRICDPTGNSCQFLKMNTQAPSPSGTGYNLTATLPFNQGVSLLQGRRTLFLIRAEAFRIDLSGVGGISSKLIGRGLAVTEVGAAL